MPRFSGRAFARSALLLTSALAAATALPAWAKDTGAGAAIPPGEDQPQALDIIVTGSRLARSTFDTPSPVTVLGGETFEQLGITNVGQGLNELPAFRPSATPATQGFGAFNVGAQIANLRGLGVERSLVLVDGRRFAPSTREGTVDLNFIPSVLVERAEVVTGGASAAYGSDALAGVINIILDKKLKGLKAQADIGISEEGDGRNVHAGLAYGGGFASDRGHFVFGGEYSDQKPIGNCFTRDWCGVGTVMVNPFFNTPTGIGNGLPNYVRSDTNGGWYLSPAGVVTSIINTSGTGMAIADRFGTGAITFAPDGTPVAAQVGSPASGLSQIGGNPLYATYTDVGLLAAVERYSLYGHASYEVADGLEGFVEANYGHVKGSNVQTAYFSPAIPIFADNPFIPISLRTQFPAGSQTQPTGPASTSRPATGLFSLTKVLDDVARGFNVSTADTYRATAGLKGRLGNSLSWDVYYQYGRTDRTQQVFNNLVVGDPTLPITDPRSNARFFYAADAVADPATGNPTCRALLSPDPALRAAAAGCVPINLFGAGNVTQGGQNYIYETLVEDIRLQQHVLAGNLRGQTGDLLAGPLSFAIGGEYRIDKINVTHDPLSNQFAYFQNFGADYRGKTEVIEGYLEAELPLIKDVPFFQALTLNGAIRQAHYSTNGFGSYLRAAAHQSFDATTWKASINWTPVGWLRLRGTQSRDVRAPNFAEQFLATAGSFTPISNPFVLTPAGTPSTNFPSLLQGGSPGLRPEKADTTTLGLVLTPPGGLRLSIDGYRIKVKDYIGQAPGGAQFLVDRCFAEVAQACSLIDRDAAGNITVIRNVQLNLDSIVARGIDFELDYRLRLGGTAALSFRGVATYVDTLKTTTLGRAVDRAGQTGNSAGADAGSQLIGAPDWLLNGFISYSTPDFMITVQGRYINSGLYDAQRIGPDDPRYSPTLPNSISDNRVASRFYINLSGSVFVGKDRNFELFGSVNNLFNRDPAVAPETQFYTNPVYFDTIGRHFRVGVRVKY